MKNFLIILFCLTVFKNFSQNQINDYISIRDQLKIYESGSQKPIEKFKGSPYLQEEFQQGVILEDGKNDLVVFFRYNVFQDQVEIKVNPSDQEIFILPRSDDFRFKVDEYIYVIGEMATDEQEVISGYIMEYYRNDKTLLLAKPVYNISSAKIAETTYDRSKPARIRINTRYFLGIDDQPLRRVNLKEKDFRKILGSSSRMQVYFSNNKIKSIEDIVKMLQFYDEQSE